MQHLSCVLHAAEARPSGPLGQSATHWTYGALDGAGFAKPRPRRFVGLKAKAKRGLVECTVASIRSALSRWPAGPGVRGAKNELNGFALSPFALVTFIWGRK